MGNTELPRSFGGLILPPLGEGRVPRALTTLLFPLRALLLLLVLGLLTGARAFAAAFATLTWPLQRVLDALTLRYPALLRGALARRGLLCGLALLLFGAALALVPSLPTALVPSLTQGELAYRLRLPEGTPLQRTREVLEQACAPLRADPRFARVFAVAGSLPSTASGRPTEGENLARLDVVLAPEARGGAAEDEARARVRAVLESLANVRAERVEAQALSLTAPVEVRLFSDELDDLEAAAATLSAALEARDDVGDVSSTIEVGNPELRVHLLRERAAGLGISAEDVAQALRRQVRGVVVGRYREREKRLDVRVRASAPYRERADALRRLRLRLGNGEVVALGSVAELSLERGPAALHHSSGARVARVQARHTGRDLGTTLGEVRGLLRSLALPPGVRAELAGQDKELAASFTSLRLALALAVFLVFVVMAAQFESLRHPLVVLLSVPLGAVGVIATLFVSGAALSVLVLIGVVMLAGIVVNNAIVLIDAVNRRRRAGEPLESAIVAGASERLRPILMTTATTVLALVPMALGWGEGNELRAPLAHTVIGGLLGGTLLTLVLIPCVYRILAAGGLGPDDADAIADPGDFDRANAATNPVGFEADDVTADSTADPSAPTAPPPAPTLAGPPDPRAPARPTAPTAHVPPATDEVAWAWSDESDESTPLPERPGDSSHRDASHRDSPDRDSSHRDSRDDSPSNDAGEA